MNQNHIRIVAAVVDTTQLTLYKETGETLILPQGDPRIRRIVDEATPGLLKDGIATVDLTQENSYSTFEAQSSGRVKLFSVAKDKLKKLFGWGKKEEQEEGEEPPVVQDISLGKVPNKLQQTQAAVAEIMAHATPVTSAAFNEQAVAQQGNIVEANGITPNRDDKPESKETIVAVVGGKVIPGMEKIKTQFSRASAQNSTVGMENFLRRLGGVIEDRSHSVEDLLKFLERGDLPIADDGSILIYKVLRLRNRSTNAGDRTYVDCHTGKVEQWVGAYVCMDPSLVDRNRNNECSNGLHVARRGYVRNFSGDVCVLAKLAPEDVIAVPTYDANKMRVCGYHIIKELSSAQYSLLNKNRPLTEDEEGKRLLADALRGVHIHKTHEVRITQQKGGGVVVTELGNTPEAKVEKKAEVVVAVALANPTEEALDQLVDPKDVMKVVEQVSRKEQARQLYEAGDIEGLKAFKKAAKVSWEKLGVPDPDVTPIIKVKPVAITPQMVSDAADAIEEHGEDELERFRDEQEAKKTRAQDTKRVVNGVALGEGSPRERIQKLMAIGLTSTGVAKAVLMLKKKSKKSWDTLGVTPDQVAQITKLTQ